MSVFKIDPAANDLIREGGAFVRTSGADEIRQGVQVRIQIFRGEIPYNLDLGFPWLLLLEKGTPPEILESQLRQRIESCPGIVEVLELSITAEDNRTASIEFRARASLPDLAQSLLIDDTLTVQVLGNAA